MQVIRLDYATRIWIHSYMRHLSTRRTVRSCSIVILAVLIGLHVRHSLLINVDSIVVTINLSVGVVVAGMDVAATP